MSFEEFINQKKALCQHLPSAKCPNCIPPSEMNYKLKPFCPKHKPWPRGLCNECQPPPCTLGRQKYRHLDYAEFMNVSAFNNFASLWQQTGMTVQRAGLLYGSYAPDVNFPDGKKAIIQAIYEPPQSSDGVHVRLMEDPSEPAVEAIAHALGLQRVGWIFTHPTRDYAVASNELRQMARFQNSHRIPGVPGSLFVTMLLSQNERGEITPSAYMASDQAMSLELADVLSLSSDPQLCQKRPVGKNELLPSIIRTDQKKGAQEVSQFETEFLLVQVNSGAPRVAPGMPAPRPMFAHNNFPFANREVFGECQTPDELKQYLLKFKSDPWHQRLSDFNLLTYLPKIFDLDSALVTAASVRDGSPMPDGIELVLQAMIEN